MTAENPARLAASTPEQADATASVHAVGVGPGNRAYLTDRARERIESAAVVVGFETVVDRVRDIGDGDILACSYDDQTERLAQFGERVAGGEDGVAVLWGDPNVSGYQFLGRVEAAVDGAVRVVPGVSSVQIAAARSRTPLEHSTFVSLHRRGEVTPDLAHLADRHAEGNHLLVLVRPYDWMPPDIATALIERGADRTATALVLEELTLPAESIEETTLGELAAQESTRERYSDRTILTVRATQDT